VAWIESHQSLGNHPKLKRLARLLSITLPTAVGHLHYLWWWAEDYAQDGDLARYSAEDIADAAQWSGSPTALVEALCNSGFLDCAEDGSLRIHDWDDFAGKLIERRKADAARKKAARSIGPGASNGTPPDVQRTSNGTPPDVRGMSSVPNLTVPNLRVPNNVESIETATQERDSGGGRGYGGDNPPADPISQIVEVVQSIPRWPVDDEKDRATAEELIEEFGVARVLEASRDLRTWTRDHPLKAGDKPRARWRNFCKPRPAKTNTPRASPAGVLPKAGLPDELRRLPIVRPDGRIIPTTPNYRGPTRRKPPPGPEETDDDPELVQEGRAPPAWPN